VQFSVAVPAGMRPEAQADDMLRAGQGIDLGMVLARRIVDLHGGELRMEKQNGVDSWIIELPVSLAEPTTKS
jgi:nitrogen-specific signal transduction histidine kinase